MGKEFRVFSSHEFNHKFRDIVAKIFEILKHKFMKFRLQKDSSNFGLNGPVYKLITNTEHIRAFNSFLIALTSI